MRGTVIVACVTGVLASCASAWARSPTGIVLLSQRESSVDVTGHVGDAAVDAAGIAIDPPKELGTVSERAAPKIPRAPLHKIGTVNKQRLREEVERSFRDIERCRFKVAAASGLPIAKVNAGEISLHWTILPSGGTRDTVVFEVKQTDLALMKCIRRRMNAWTFTAPRGGPLPVDYDYTFPALGSP